jgi:hypothetical protein
MLCVLVILCVGLLAVAEGCGKDGGNGGSDSDSDGDSDSDSDADPPPGLTAVDILLAVDNSGSMAEEQQLIADDVATLVDALLNPPSSWDQPDVDDIRIAVVSSDMGLSWGGNPYENGDGWPGDAPPSCSAVGDDGDFYSGGTWYETTAESLNPQLAPQTADCLGDLGTQGCGFEQQLESAARGLERSDHADFLREEALLAVLLVSDEEDCSIESNGLFGVNEIQHLADNKVNLACSSHPQYLYEPGSYRDRWTAVKDGEPGAVVFAAIVGVPISDACEGRGHQIGDCLDHQDMELEVVIEGEGGAYFYRPACERYEGDVQVTKARPGRRYVELAQQYGSGGYLFSICNAGWTAAVEELAQMIGERMDAD